MTTEIREGISNEDWIVRQREKMVAKRLASLRSARCAPKITFDDVVERTEREISTAVGMADFFPSDSRQSHRLVELLVQAGETLAYDCLTVKAREYVDRLVARGWITEAAFKAMLAFARHAEVSPHGTPK